MRARGRLEWGGVLALACATGCTQRAALPAVDPVRLHARVVHQVAQGPRVPGTPGHAAVRDWIAAELARLGARVERQPFVDSTLGRPVSLENLIGHFEAAGGGPGERHVVLAAHFDTRPVADMDTVAENRSQPIPGANDGASGVAVLLEVAELLAEHRAPIRVDLVFFDGEDLGRPSEPETYSLGARGYAARLVAPLPIAAFVFDMVGDRDLQIHPEAYSSERAASLVALVAEAAQATGSTGFKPGVRYRVTDDHLPLLDAGIPAVDIIDFDYPAWHTLADTPDQVSGASLAQVARVAAWIVYASSLARPR
ncbi:MAG: M28 family peptidase [Candidatus Eisenbacteria bacterium]|uniref:M28 family peptidase n=1 Tax=Eiseniibacteriota bacterium TaxID=2212470 RepID=A0A849SEX7_UNCEI|nr:M28 family peptidase [Candidatus Eisenbacteria bacterium]